jgi:hypothetical protein
MIRPALRVTLKIKLVEKSDPFSKGLLFLEVNGKMLTM